MIHYHGTPVNPKEKLFELRGRCFCVSFYDPRQVLACHQIGQSVMLDNGAFSAWASGQSPDWDAYHRWCEPWLDYHTTWAVIPDVIDGDENDNDRLVERWPHGRRGAPVWHLHESLKRLERLCHEWPRVCLGSSGEYSQPGSDRWHRRMISAFNRIAPNGKVPCWIHMLRGLDFAGGFYPFASADSTNIARNHHRDGLEKVNDIDSRQCPALWTPPGEQEELCIG